MPVGIELGFLLRGWCRFHLGPLLALRELAIFEASVHNAHCGTSKRLAKHDFRIGNVDPRYIVLYPLYAYMSKVES